MGGGRIPLDLCDGRGRVPPGNLAKKLARGLVSVTIGHLGGAEPRCFPMAFPRPTPRKGGKRKRETLATSPPSQSCVKRQFLAVLGPGSIEYRENRTIDYREQAHHQSLRPSRRRDAARDRCGPSGARCRRHPSSRHSPRGATNSSRFSPKLGTRNPWRRHTLRPHGMPAAHECSGKRHYPCGSRFVNKEERRRENAVAGPASPRRLPISIANGRHQKIQLAPGGCVPT